MKNKLFFGALIAISGPWDSGTDGYQSTSRHDLPPYPFSEKQKARPSFDEQACYIFFSWLRGLD